MYTVTRIIGTEQWMTSPVHIAAVIAEAEKWDTKEIIKVIIPLNIIDEFKCTVKL